MRGSPRPSAGRESLATRTRLWLSYQRYALLFFALGAAPLCATLALGLPWWTHLVASAAAPWAWTRAVQIARRYRDKLRLTRAFVRRIARGGYSPVLLSRYAGDPCHRVVIDEILRQSRFSRAERRTMLAELRARHEAESNVVVVLHPQATTSSLTAKP